MNIPAFSAQASLYRTSNHYRSVVAVSDGSIPAQSVVAAYIPGPETQNRCSGCTDKCVNVRNFCLAETAAMVAEACLTSLGFGCGAAIALGEIQAASCEEGYLSCFGICNIPSADGIWESSCCPKVCGIPTPGVGGSGCCDHGETCVGLDSPNTRDGCCPVGQYCGGNCCARGESCCGNTCCPSNYFCLEGGICTEFPPFTPPGWEPPPPPENNCIFGGEPCGRKCCPPGKFCCGLWADGTPKCWDTCLH